MNKTSQNKWKIINQILQENKEKIRPGNFHFYNISHSSIVAKKTEEFSSQCDICKQNLEILLNLAKKLPDALGTDIITSDTKLFENQMEKVVKHLKDKHDQRFAGYYTSLYSFLGLLIGIISGIIISFIFNKKIFTNYLFISIIFNLLIGRFAGNLKDRKFFKENKLI